MSPVEAKARLIKERAVIQKKLRHWYAEYQRNLPWRHEPTLYKTVVSEFMLQQTHVNTVVPYFQRWIAVFHDFKTLAEAKEQTVLKYWEGLGYYSRARSLHKLARVLVKEEVTPSRYDEWIQYAGIGPYTAAAISSISFNYPAAVIDGNVIRILTRLTADATVFRDNNTAHRELGPLADILLNKKDPGTHNQAMMELGATICLRSKPRCAKCPILANCTSGNRGDMEIYPRLKQRQTHRIKIKRLWVEQDSTLLLHRASPKSKRLADIYELPSADGLVNNFRGKKCMMKKTRAISNQRIEERIYRVKPTMEIASIVESTPELHWISLARMKSITLSGPHRRWINETIGD